MRTVDHQVLSAIRSPVRGRVFVVGTGRSLLEIPDEVWTRMAGETVIGVNFLARWPNTRTTVKPSVWVANNPGEFLGIADLVEQRGGARIFVGSEPPLALTARHPTRTVWAWVEHNRKLQLANGAVPLWLGYPERPFAPWTTAPTVIWDAIQVAAWMGSREIYLLGVDADDRGHVWDGSEEPSSRAAKKIASRVAAMTQAHSAFARYGIALSNASPGGNLDIPRVELAAVLSGGTSYRGTDEITLDTTTTTTVADLILDIREAPILTTPVKKPRAPRAPRAVKKSVRRVIKRKVG